MFDIFMCHGSEEFYNKPSEYETPLVLSYRSSDFSPDETDGIRELRKLRKTEEAFLTN
jgi:hypothetical protein